MSQSTGSLRAPERQRVALLPIVAKAFAELGYRKATTARLARRCGVQETEMYRIWPSKREMFLAAIDFVYADTVAGWTRLLEGVAPAQAAVRILEHQATRHGATGLYRIIFAGLNEVDDAEVRARLRALYRRFHRFVAEHVTEHRRARGLGADEADVALTSWALVGLGAVSDIGRELRLLSGATRSDLMNRMGRRLLDGGQEATA